MSAWSDFSVGIEQRPIAPKPTLTTGTHRHVWTRPDGVRVFASWEQDATRAADAARLDYLERMRGRTEAAPATASEAVWSREPSPAQAEARNRAYSQFISNLPFWTGEGMPRIAWRWLTEHDEPILRRAWGICRWRSPGAVEIILRADMSPAQTYSTTLHELCHAGDHELMRWGVPTAALELRARHVQQILGED